MSIVGLVAWLVAAPISSDSLHDLAELPPVRNCSKPRPDERQFAAPITMFLDRHGSVGELAKRREIGFTLDFSRVNLDRDYPALLKQIYISSGLTLRPIDLRVQGYFRAERDRGRRVMMVTHIYNWRKSNRPPLFLEKH